VSDATWLVQGTVGAAAVAVIIWRAQRVLRPKLIARKVAELAIVEDHIEEALEANSNASTSGIVEIAKRELGERGYPERVLAMVTEGYVEEVRRARKRNGTRDQTRPRPKRKRRKGDTR
jgi:hypothetical protein